MIKEVLVMTRGKTKHLATILMGILIAVTILPGSALTPNEVVPAEPYMETLVYGTTEKVTDMDPASAYDFHTWEIFQNVYQGLLKYAPGETTLVPGLAESYEISADGKVYTFELRKGLRFSDGTLFDAQVVKWSIDRVAALKGDPSSLVTDFVDRVLVRDTYVVSFILKYPVAYFPSLVATPPYYPVNPNVYPRDKIIHDPSKLKGGKLVGLGAYRAVSFKRNKEIVLEANPDFYGEKPKTERVVIRYFASARSLRRALKKGKIDFAFKTFSHSDIKDLQQSEKIQTIKAQGSFIRFVCFLCDTPPFNNRVLRRAVAAAINRPQITEQAFLGEHEPLYSMVPMGLWSHIDTFRTALGDGNVAKARELLASQGHSESNPLTFDLWYTRTHYGDTEADVAAVLKDQLEATGMMNVKVKSAGWAAYKDKWAKKTMSAWLLGWYPDYTDPDNYTVAFGGTGGSKQLGINFTHPQWDKKLVEGQEVMDSVKRTGIYGEIQQMWTEDVPTVPISQLTLHVFAQKGIRGILLSPTLEFNYGLIYRSE